MGFELELLLLYPATASLAQDASQSFDEPVSYIQRKIWSAHERIDFGRTTRLAKMTDYPHIEFWGHERAAVSMTSVLLSKMFPMLSTEPRRVLANPILVYDLEGPRPDHASYGPDDKPSINVGLCDDEYSYSRSLNQKRIARHNEVMAYDDKALAPFIEQYHPVVEAPYIWESCAQLAAWLEEAETEQSLEWKEVLKDPVSATIFRARRAYLREIAAADTRALFLFS